jgi:putative membrane protein
LQRIVFLFLGDCPRARFYDRRISLTATSQLLEENVMRANGKTLMAAASVSCLILLGGLSACNKAERTEAGNTTESAAAEAGSMAGGAGSAIADAVTHDTPQQFAEKAAVANLFEIETSKLAVKTSKNKDVLAFANKMITDHTKAGTAFKAAVGKASGVTAPAEKLDDAHQSKLDDLKTKTGEDFDKAYIDAQQDAHDEAVSLFDSYANNGTDAALKAFAAETLPTLKAHEEHIDKM